MNDLDLRNEWNELTAFADDRLGETSKLLIF
jgi:hypothetical protein